MGPHSVAVLLSLAALFGWSLAEDRRIIRKVLRAEAIFFAVSALI
jgi:hypothetical protein